MTRPLALIIEDDPHLGAIFEKTLETAGFDTALDAEGNLYSSILATRQPALVILDLHLPYATGAEILEDLRNRYPAWSLSVIIVTADLYQAKDLKAKGETVLVKPVSPARLIDIASRIKDTLEGSP
jgi:two-component system KDP operon response regulator KdpE